MRVPVSWLRTLVPALENVSSAKIAEKLTNIGLQVERIEQLAGELSGPIVVGRVLEFESEPQKNGKTIRWCQVDVGEDTPRGIVCGAHNFVPGDLVIVSLPGAVLPGPFEISARKTYGHISDGMICAEDELGIGDDHEGILVLDPIIDGTEIRPGDDGLDVLQLRGEVFEIDVTPDLGHCLSMRGIAREVAQAFGEKFDDPYSEDVPPAQNNGFPVTVESDNCKVFTAQRVSGIDPTRSTPMWMKRRLQAAGIRSVCLAVDVTNYVMVESGQPLHAYDEDTLSGGLLVRQAKPGEKMTTLDHVDRQLSGEDLLVCDDSGPIGLAGVMGGLTTEVTDNTTNIVIEAANFAAVTISRTFRRHKLASESSKRFERQVDPNVAYAAGKKAVDLLVHLGGGVSTKTDLTVVGQVAPMPTTKIKTDLPAKVLGGSVSAEDCRTILEQAGVKVEQAGEEFLLTPPSWRADLVDPYDYVEEVGCKFGFDKIAPTLPTPPAGRGLTKPQRCRRDIRLTAVDYGFVEVITLPFIGEQDLTNLGVKQPDVRSRTVKLANPLSDAQPYLRTTLLPGLFKAIVKNTSRSQTDLTLFECGLVFHQVPAAAAPMPEVSSRPSEEEIARLENSLPQQPHMFAGVLTGDWQSKDWRGKAVPASWSHAIELGLKVGRSVGLDLTVRQSELSPWHPGRCAALQVGDQIVGYAGELHPNVCKSFTLPDRTCAIELNLDLLISLSPDNGEILPLSSFPLTKEDVALVVDKSVPAGDVAEVLSSGCGDLVESVTLFDVYTGDQVGPEKKSLAFSLGFRSPDRTLNEAEAMEALERGVQKAVEVFSAVRRA